MTEPARVEKGATRRHFLQTSSALAAASLTASLAASSQVQADKEADGNHELKVGLIGCGGRGTGAAAQALRADRKVKLWALADAFEDRLQGCLTRLQADRDIVPKIDVPADRRFVGFEGYRQVIAACDVVLLCTPPHFRPLHLRAAVQANRHVFAEKPCAVDAPGVRSVLETCQDARRRNLSVVAGLCLRFDNAYKEIVRRIQDGAIGDVVALQANDLRGPIWHRSRAAGWTDMQWHLRNWYYYTWLSGDFNVEQHVHFLDVAAWILRDTYPVRCYGTGGRQVRTGADYGNIYDHFSIVYEYENGVRLYSTCRQQAGCRNDMSCHVLGSRGTGQLIERRRGMMLRNGNREQFYEGPANDMYQAEHDALFASIRNRQPINNGEYMARSSLLAIMGRMAAYTGQVITWQQALDSREQLAPAEYTWEAQPPVSQVSMPGVTRFV